MSRAASNPETRKHLSQLCADLPFVIAKWSGQQLSSSQVALLLQRQTVTGEKNFEREHDGRIWTERLYVSRKRRHLPNRGKAAQSLKPLAS